MRDFERLVVPIIVIMMITGLCCYYIYKEYNEQQRSQVTENQEDIEVLSEEELKYDTLAILIGKNTAEGMLTFQSLDSGKQASYSYNGVTEFLGKHGNNIAINQLQLGEIVDVSYSVHTGALDKVQVSDSTWTQTDVSRFEIDENNGSMKIGNSLYRLDNNLVVSYGDRLAKLIDVTSVDTLTVKGKDKTVYSIIVDKGHGYIRLTNDAYFLGGWLEVGQEIIKPVTENMLLPIPEGEYHVRVTNKGYEGDDDIKVERDRETIVDLSDIDIKEVAIGHIQFDISPDYAQLFIDNEMTDFEERVPLEYGVHRVHVELAGYTSVDTNIKVSQEYADVSIELDKSTGSSSSSSNSLSSNSLSSNGSASSTAYASSSSQSTASNDIYNSSSMTNFRYTNTNPTPSPTPTPASSSTSVLSTSVSSSVSSSILTPTQMPGTSSTSHIKATHASTAVSSTSSSSSSFYLPFYDFTASEAARIYIDGPAGATVYIDGMYVGVAPTASNNVTGPHIVTLMDENGNIKSFSVNVEDGSTDVSYSFSFGDE